MLNKMASFIIDLIFPPRCAVCGEVTQIGTEICESCFGRLKNQLHGSAMCSRCGKPADSCICQNISAISECVSVFKYGDDTRNLMEKLKTDGSDATAKQLAEMMASRYFSSDLCNISFNCITYVPSSAERTAAKGFDHAQRLAKQLSLKLNIPCIAPPIKQTSDYRAQHTLARNERFENADRGYALSDGKAISGNLLLVDDIITTGATLDRCAKLLLICGADKVFCITAATTVLDNASDNIPC